MKRIDQLVRIMQLHCIEYRLQDEKLWVLDYTLWPTTGMHVQWVDATTWTVADAKRWIGY